MLHFGDILIDAILIPFLLAVYIVVGSTGVVLGLGLMFRAPQTVRLLASLNRWTSLRKNLKPLEEPHDIDHVVYRHRHWFGAVFALAGVFVVFMLLARVEFAALTTALSGTARPIVIAILVEAVRWFLIGGGVLAVGIGLMLIASADLVPAIGTWLNQWYSPRRFGKGADKMVLTLDDWAAAFPRTMGALLTFGSAVVLVTAAIVWLGE